MKREANGSANPDPYQNVMDPQHCENPLKKLDCGAQMGRGGKVGSWRGRSEGAELEGENEVGGGVPPTRPPRFSPSDSPLPPPLTIQNLLEIKSNL